VVLLGIVGTLVTFAAWCRRPRPDLEASTTSPSVEYLEADVTAVDISPPEIESIEKNLVATP
jgi:hypothetical protein